MISMEPWVFLVVNDSEWKDATWVRRVAQPAHTWLRVLWQLCEGIQASWRYPVWIRVGLVDGGRRQVDGGEVSKCHQPSRIRSRCKPMCHLLALDHHNFMLTLIARIICWNLSFHIYNMWLTGVCASVIMMAADSGCRCLGGTHSNSIITFLWSSICFGM